MVRNRIKNARKRGGLAAAGQPVGGGGDIVACEFTNQVASTTQQIGPVPSDTFESLALTGAVNLNAGDHPTVICTDLTSSQATSSERAPSP